MRTKGKKLDGYYVIPYAENIGKRGALLQYLCFVNQGFYLPDYMTDGFIERMCAGCEAQCGYGKRWLELYWAEEDEAWERSRPKGRVDRRETEG